MASSENNTSRAEAGPKNPLLQPPLPPPPPPPDTVSVAVSEVLLELLSLTMQ